MACTTTSERKADTCWVPEGKGESAPMTSEHVQHRKSPVGISFS